jgi:hypothetical protein
LGTIRAGEALNCLIIELRQCSQGGLCLQVLRRRLRRRMIGGPLGAGCRAGVLIAVAAALAALFPALLALTLLLLAGLEGRLQVLC